MNGWRWSAPRQWCKLCYQHRQTCEHVAPLTGCGATTPTRSINIHLLTEVQSMYSCRKPPNLPVGGILQEALKMKIAKLQTWDDLRLNLKLKFFNLQFSF